MYRHSANTVVIVGRARIAVDLIAFYEGTMMENLFNRKNVGSIVTGLDNSKVCGGTTAVL